MSDDGDAEEVDGVHVKGDGDDVEWEGGVRHAGDGAGPGQVGRLQLSISTQAHHHQYGRAGAGTET